MAAITIVLADDHALVRDGIKTLLEDEDDLRVVGEARDGREAVALVTELAPDLLVTDIRMPPVSGIEAVRELKRAGSPTPCLVLSMHDSEEYVLQSIDAGADGYLLKDASREEFVKAIRSVTRGERYFSGDLSNILLKQILGGGAAAAAATPAPTATAEADLSGLTKRERQILDQVTLGKSNQEIADEIGLSRRTVETHRFNMMKKLGVNSQGELLRLVGR